MGTSVQRIYIPAGTAFICGTKQWRTLTVLTLLTFLFNKLV